MMCVFECLGAPTCHSAGAGHQWAAPPSPAKQQPGEPMPETLVQPPRHPYQTFLNFPLVTELDRPDAHIAILGLPYGAPYRMSEVTNDQTNAPTAVRVASARLAQALDRHDFDIGGPLFAGKAIRVVDCGDVVADPRDMNAHYRNAEAAAKKILARAGMLISIGGDHGVPIPIFRALEKHGPITMVHVDAHLDWRDEVNGVKEGYSNPFRRASEMKWIEGMFQIGLRARARRGRRSWPMPRPTARRSSPPTTCWNRAWRRC